MKKYNILYAKRTARLVLIISAPISILFFTVSLFYNVLEYDILFSFFPILIGLFLWTFNLLHISSAIKLFRLQATQLNVVFDDTNARALYPSSTIFLSDSWFIASGQLYLHKNFIQSITIKTRKTNRGNNYYCAFKCLDKTHTIHVDSSASAKWIKCWFKEKG